MKNLLLILLLTIAFQGQSQDYTYLENIKLKKKQSFIENENTAIKAVDFLINTPFNENNIDRKDCSRFVIKYATKTPFISMTIDEAFMQVEKGNSGLITLFMGLWIKSAINNKKESDKFHEEYAYTEIYKYSKNGNNISQTEIIKSLIAAGDKGQIKNWIKDLKKKYR